MGIWVGFQYPFTGISVSLSHRIFEAEREYGRGSLNVQPSGQRGDCRWCHEIKLRPRAFAITRLVGNSGTDILAIVSSHLLDLFLYVCNILQVPSCQKHVKPSTR